MLKSLYFKKNKGIAMITIMITIAFLSIIATTILYISSSNYAMKAANTLGKTNYYETEAKLVEVSTTIRNTAMNSGDPAQNIVSNYCSSTTTVGDLQAGTAHYDLAKLIPAGTGSEFTFSSTDNRIICSNHPTESSVKRYVFKDIEVKHTSAKGFENSVKTDLIIDVHEKTIGGGGGGGGVGNMSMLLDSPLSSSNSLFKNLTMAGNAFVADYKNPTSPVSWDGHTYIAPGENGLVMTNQSRLNFRGDYNVVYGDLKLSGDASLAVYGNLTVYGNISVTGNATLIFSDGAKLYQFKDEPLPGRTGNATFTLGNATKNIYPAGTTPISVSKDDFKSFCETINIVDTTPSTGYGLISSIFVKGPKDKNGNQPFGANKNLMELNVPFDNLTRNDVTGLTKSNRDLERGYEISNSVYGLPKFGFAFILNQNTEKDNMNSSNYTNRLMLSYNSKKITLLNTCPNTTWISVAPVTCDLQHCVTLSKIGATEFNYMTAGKGDAASKAYDIPSNPFNNLDIVFNGVTFKGKFGAFFDKECNTTIDNMFGYSSGSGSGSSSVVYSSAITFDNFTRDYE